MFLGAVPMQDVTNPDTFPSFIVSRILLFSWNFQTIGLTDVLHPSVAPYIKIF